MLIVFSIQCFFMATLVTVSCIMLYKLYRLQKEVTKLKTNLVATCQPLDDILNKMKLLMQSATVQSNLLMQLNQQKLAPSPPSQASADMIENQYDRARRILKNNTNTSSQTLDSCNMTDEELELLTDLFKQEEMHA